MSHQVATLGNMGLLIPVTHLEVAPGDTWSGRVGMLLRLSPLKRALLQDIYVDTFAFYVPHRLVWSGWEDFIAAGPNDDSAVTTPPTLTNDSTYLFQTGNGITASTYNELKVRAYNLIYNEFFRDVEAAVIAQDRQVSSPLQVSGKRHYWNELREQVAIGADATAPVITGTPDTVKAEDILRAIAQEKLQMKRATYGTRYVDILKSYGVSVNYQMLQRPEIVGMGRSSMNITDIAGTNWDSTTTGLGRLAGYGVGNNRLRIRRKSFPEHGTLMFLAVVRPTFVDWAIHDWMDGARGAEYASYYDPQLELLPTQEVNAGDVVSPVTNNDATAIGYMPWGQWYRQATNRVHVDLAGWTAEQFGFAAGTWDGHDLLQTQLRDGVYNASDWDSLFEDTTYGHFQISAAFQLRAQRLIKPNNPGVLAGST